MKALIIAAGNGTRMQPVTRGRHKSLMELLGLRIIERVILGAREAGISEFVIVTGYKGREFQKAVGDGRKYGVSIKYAQNNDWHKANGISVLKAKNYLKDEQFALLMSDHVFSYKTLIRIQRLKLKGNECALAVDRHLDVVLDLADTTKAVVRENKVIALNKSLETYNAFDTGMFICSPYIFKVLEQTTKHGKNSLSDCMRVLAGQGLLRAFDNRGRFWADCDTYADIKFAEKKLLSSLKKSADGIVSKKLNRPVSTFITRRLIKTPITPNMISFSIPLMAIAAFLVLSKGTYPWLIFGAFLVQFMSIFDGCDGELARLKFIGSDWGGFLDATLDKYVDTAVIAGMAYGYWRVSGNELIWLVSAFLLLALILDGYMPNKFSVLMGKKLSWKGFNFKRDTRLLLLAVGIILNQIMLVLVISLVLLNYMVVARLVFGKKISEGIAKQPSISV